MDCAEVSPGSTSVAALEFRTFPVSGISQRLGGGGHMYAAGAYVDGPQDEVVARVLLMAGEVIAETATRTRGENGV